MIVASHGIICSQISQVPQVSDADAQLFVNRVYTAGGVLSTTELNAVNDLVIDLKADGIWTKMKAIYPMVGASAAACAQNLKSSSFTGVFSTGWTFSSAGAKPNGTSAYMNTNFSWVSADLNNSAFGSYWTDYIATTTSKYYGGYSAAGVHMINQKSPNGDNYMASFTGINANMENGFHAINRSSSTSIDFILNNTISSTSSNSSSVYTDSQWIGGVSGNTQFGYIGWNHALSFFSEGLNSTQWSDFYTAVQSFQTTLSRQV